jgi:hypothetical protein
MRQTRTAPITVKLYINNKYNRKSSRLYGKTSAAAIKAAESKHGQELTVISLLLVLFILYAGF